MKLSSRLTAHIETLLSSLLEFNGPADKVVRRFFSTYPELGQSERGLIRRAVFEVLRYKTELAYLAAAHSRASLRQLTLLALLRVAGCSAVQAVMQANETEWFRHAASIDPRRLPAHVQMNLPDWLAHTLTDRFGVEEGRYAAAAFNASAPLDLRINPLKVNRTAAVAALAKVGIQGIETSLAPLGIRLSDKPDLRHVPAFNQGYFEIQDEGSQLICHLLAPKRGETIVDFCAGAGGKTLTLGALMRSTGRVYAFDVNGKRLGKLKPRLAKSGLSNIISARIDHTQDKKLERLTGKVDRVLVDAPCSGLGTLRRNPDLKWRYSAERMRTFAELQRALLVRAAALVKLGGRLVYSTCSMLEIENEAVVVDFMVRQPGFRLISATEILAKQHIHLATGDYLSLWPHRHATDGFFAAVFERYI